MKIAIQGHPTRGKEVIQILESLGGKNRWFHEGSNSDCYYELHKDCIWCANTRSEYFKYYTIEEFEKEFPFKVGDKVIHKEYDSPFEIIEFDPENVYPYTIDGLCEFRTKSCALTKYQLKMKEERNITLTLDKAKEWYKKGGELREIALQAFTEMELNSLPRSWKDYCKNYPIKPEEIFIDGYSRFIVNNVGDRNPVHDKNICPSRKSAEAHLALIQLEQLRNCWWNGWEPIWDISHKWCIRLWGNELNIGIATNISRFLTFPTKEIAEEFLKCFRDLIEKAGNLI